jgi:uncharacterized membrane protein YgcG
MSDTTQVRVPPFAAVLYTAAIVLVVAGFTFAPAGLALWAPAVFLFVIGNRLTGSHSSRRRRDGSGDSADNDSSATGGGSWVGGGGGFGGGGASGGWSDGGSDGGGGGD